MTGTTETLAHLDVDPALRPLARAMALRGPSWWTVLAMELRKAVDIRASRWLLLAALLLAVVTSASGVAQVGGDPAGVELAPFLDRVLLGVTLLLPLVGVLVVASEWSRRTALSTFALVPRRGRVLSAKVAAALLVVVTVVLVCGGVGLAGAALAARVAGVPVVLDGGVAAVVSAVATTALLTLVGVGIGALAGSTSVGVLAYLVLPLGFSLVAPQVLGDAAAWVDGVGVFERVAEGTTRPWAPTGTALALWVALPLALGTARFLRREMR